MCGIVGIVSTQAVANPMMGALKRLEYRGYDSAGIATLESGRLSQRRAPGKLCNLERMLLRQPLGGNIGIGHTRWATHGKPNELNAHPHRGKYSALVHNGIIENFRELRDELTSRGHLFRSETDSEAVVHLIDLEIENGKPPFEAVRAAMSRLKGAYALAFLFEGEEDLLIAARRNSPLAVGFGKSEMYVGSDAIALAPFTDEISYLDDGDVAVLSRNAIRVFDENGTEVHRTTTRTSVSNLLIEKGTYRHFMSKEIAEQPDVVLQTLSRYVDLATERLRPLDFPFDCAQINRISISGCGTAYYAGMIGKYWLERFSRLSVDTEFASELRYREPQHFPGSLSLFVSQSGETADTLASLRYAKRSGQHVVSVVNVPSSSIARESDLAILTCAGPEIGVASTKAFTCQLMAIAALSIILGRRKGVLSELDERRLVQGLIAVPSLMTETMRLEPQIKKIAREIYRCRDVLYLGRGTSYPLALEGALKLKEISYIHAEGYAAGELKHGPIALVDQEIPIVVVAPYDRVFEKTVSNMQEVSARGGKILLLTDSKGAAEAGNVFWRTLVLPSMAASFTSLVYALPLQLLAYHAAIERGTDVDQPRNLAKSVTVE
ncbi:MAG: glutamine--fructose-6-phosphate transaminase (isomerizing) [Nitrobacter sp.]|jgi:glutamine---fructose-6-phosphate transaminase (isomerizing)